MGIERLLDPEGKSVDICILFFLFLSREVFMHSLAYIFKFGCEVS